MEEETKRVVLEIEADTGGADQKLEKTADAVDKIHDNAGEASKGIRQMFGNLSSVGTALNSAAKQASRAMADVRAAFGGGAIGASIASGMKSVTEAAGRVGRDVMDRIRGGVDETTRSYNELAEAARAYEKIDVAAVRKEIERTDGKLESMAVRMEKMKDMDVSPDSKSFRSLLYDIDAAKAKMAELRDVYAKGLSAEFRRVREEAAALGEARVETEEYARMKGELEAVYKQLEKYYDRQERMEGNGVRATSAQWRHLRQDIEKAEDNARRYEAAIARMEQQGRAYTIGIGTEEAKAAIDDLEAQLATLQAQMGNFRLDGVDEASGKFIALEFDIVAVQNKLAALNGNYVQALTGELEQARNALRDMSSVRIETDQYKAITAEIKKTEEQLSFFRDGLGKLREAGAVPTSPAWIEWQGDVDRTTAKIEELKAKLRELQDAGQGVSYVPNEAFMATDAYAERVAEIEQMEARLAEAQAAATSYGAAVDAAMSRGAEGTEEMRSAFQRVTDAARGVGGVILSGIGGAAKAAGRTVLSSLGQSPKAAFGLLSMGASGAVSALKSLGKHASQQVNPVKKLTHSLTSLGTMLRSRFKRMIVTAIFGDIKESFGQLAQVSEPFNQAVSSMIDSAKAFGAQLVAAVEPLVTTFGPAVASVVDKLTEGANAIAQFTARITGNETYVKATKGQSNYAKSLDDTTKATKQANKAAQEYKRTVMGFDQLNKLDGQDVEAAPGIDKAAMGFAETDATAMNSIADRIYDALTRHDFRAAGKAVADGIREVTDGLASAAGWKGNSGEITAAMRSVADTVNGFAAGLVENGIEIGANIGDLANSVVEGFHTLVTSLEGQDIGSGLAAVIRGFLQEVHWDTLGADIIDGIELALDMVTGFFSSGVMGDLGRAFTDFIHGAVKAIDPGKWGDALAAVINGITEFFASFKISAEDVGEFVQKLTSALGTAIRGIDIEQLGQAVHQIFENIFSIIFGAIAGLAKSISEADWGEIARGVGNAVIGIIEGAVNGIRHAFNAAIDIINGLGFTVPDWVPVIGGNEYRINIPKVNDMKLPRLANGGVVGDGQLFIANEGGRAEYIGDDGRGRTAIVNNAQIVQAVSNGVKAAMLEALEAMSRSQQQHGRGGSYGPIYLVANGRTLAQTVNDANLSMGKQYNTVEFA